MTTSTYRRAAEVAAKDPYAIPDLPAYSLPDLIPSKRGSALYAFENRTRGVDADDAAGRIVAHLALDPDSDSQDFMVAIEIRNRALGKLLDPSTYTTVRALAEVWRTCPESILAEAVKTFSAVKPDDRLSGSGELSI